MEWFTSNRFWVLILIVFLAMHMFGHGGHGGHGEGDRQRSRDRGYLWLRQPNLAATPLDEPGIKGRRITNICGSKCKEKFELNPEQYFCKSAGTPKSGHGCYG